MSLPVTTVYLYYDCHNKQTSATMHFPDDSSSPLFWFTPYATPPNMKCLSHRFYQNPDDRPYKRKYGFLLLSTLDLLPELKQIINAYLMILFIEEKSWYQITDEYYGNFSRFTQKMVEMVEIDKKHYFHKIYQIVGKDTSAIA